ncbi:MAG: fibronectin type III domain-containing protein [Pseudarcicella sp.]|nr:fibronectin type III domain-containing protein [Pseudarcicella sp.]
MATYLRPPMLVFFILLSLHSFSQKFHRIEAKISEVQLKSIFEKGFEVDHFDFKNNILTAEISDNDIKVLQDEKISFKYLIKDLEASYKKINKEIDKKNARISAITNSTTPSNFALGSYNGFFTFQEMQNHLDQMRALYPNLISAKTSLGNSIEGRPLLMVKISDNPDSDENEPEVLMNAVHHAREPMSMSQLIYFMWYLLENYNSNPEIKHILNSSELYLIPCLNPDGYVFNQTNNPNGGGMWRKNRRNNENNTTGVDLNRNYGYNWGFNNTGSSPNSSSDTYRGPNPFSEPETQIIKNFCENHQFVTSMDFHSYGNFCLYPFGFDNITNSSNPENSVFSEIGIFLTKENNYRYGNANKTVNYSTNGSGEDWKYGEQNTKSKIYSFIPEVGSSTDGFYPAQSRIIPICESSLAMNLNLLKLSSKYSEFTPFIQNTTTQLNGNIGISLKNFTLKNPSYWLIAKSNSPYVNFQTDSLHFANMNAFQVANDQFNYTLSPNTPIGTVIDFQLVLHNGMDSVVKNINTTYNCAAPQNLSITDIGTDIATLSWQFSPDSVGYYFSYKSADSTNWLPSIFTNSNFIILNNLSPSTLYNWKIQKSNCNLESYSQFITSSLCTVPLGLITSSITSNSAQLSWLPSSNTNSYQLELKPNSSNSWQIISNNLNSTNYVLTALSPNTIYDWRVKENCINNTSNYAFGQFSTTASPNVYCASKGNNISYFWIDYFSLSNFNRTSGADAGYFNGTLLAPANVIKNNSYNLNYSAGYSSSTYRVYWSAWIDYNKDGDFQDAGELLFTRNISSSGTLSSSFTVPNTAQDGQTRLRIAMKYGSTANTCETFNYGEVEDYLVNISNSPTSAKIGTNQDSDNNWTIKLSPNPTSDFLKVEVENIHIDDLTFKITDTKGTTLKIKDISKIDEKSVKINVKNLSTGMYILKASKFNELKSSKFIKK